MTRKAKSPNKSASTIWGGRFDGGPSAIMEQINASIDFDRRLYAQDIAASKAHCAMLVAQEIIDAQDGDAIQQGLDQIQIEIAEDRFEFRADLEDIHMNVENRLRELIGDAAGRLHTARSRNDQVATDFKLWVRDAFDQLDHDLQALQVALIAKAEQHAATVMPGFTHLQTAQPVTFGHHLLAYVEMLGRDRGRAHDARQRMNESPLGAGALAGTSFPIDRENTASALGFDGPAANSLDAVSDRDFALEYLATAAILMDHLSRLGEEIVVWTSERYGFVRLSDGFSTGSSMMPQKRNPDAAELVRAKAGRVIAALTGLLIVVKGLPLAYSKDLQEDKVPVFETADTLALALAATTGMIDEMSIDAGRMADAAAAAHSDATDLADWLVKRLNRPFRDAHHTTGELVKLAEQRKVRLQDLSLAEMQTVDDDINDEVFSVLGAEKSVTSKTSFGGTAPENVTAACAAARRKYVSEAM